VTMASEIPKRSNFTAPTPQNSASLLSAHSLGAAHSFAQHLRRTHPSQVMPLSQVSHRLRKVSITCPRKPCRFLTEY
jgi:hypothetical protein